METAPPGGAEATGDPAPPAPNEQAALAEAAGAIAAAGDLDAALRAMCAGVRALLPVDSTRVRLPAVGPEADFSTYRELCWQGGERYTWHYGHLRPGGDTARLLDSGQAQYVADMGQAAATGNVSAWLAWHRAGIASSLRVPLRTGGRIVGVLYANSGRPDAFSAAALGPLQVLADHAGAAVELARLRAQARERLRRLEVAERVSAAVNAADDLDGMLGRVLAEAAGLVGAVRGTVALVDADRRVVRGHVGLGQPPGLLETTVRRLHAAPHPEEDIYALVVRTGEQAIVEDDHPALHRPTMERFGLAHERRVLTPIRHAGAVIGVLTVAWTGDEQPGGEQLALLRLIAEQAGGAIARARLVEAERAQLHARLAAEAARAEQAASAEAARAEARAILDATDEGIALVAPDGRYLSANRRFAALFGLDQQALPGRRVGDFAGTLDRVFDFPDSGGRFAAYLADPTTDVTLDLRQRWPVARDLTLFSTPVRSADGRALGRLFAFRDVTRERAADRLKDEFVAMVSHELRTPLTSIKGYVDLLLDGGAGPLAAEQHEFLTVVRDSTDREVALVNDLLDLSRLEAGHVRLAQLPLDLVPLLGRAAAALRPQLAAKRQCLAMDLPCALPPVAGDAARLAQVFTNLLANAHRYTPDGGQITIAAAVADDHLRVDVRDTGVGIAPDDQARLFTKFFRARNQADEQAGGSGLGLAISRSLVELHGGRITVASTAGAGSTFSVTLPRLAAPPERSPSQ
jgi:PAS domain S-box-containing protein